METDTMKKCPFCAEMIKAEAVKCRYCNSDLREKSSFTDFLTTPGFWQRVNEGKKIAGVCTGVARQLDSPILIMPLRLFFIITTIFYGFGIILYVVLWLLMPPPIDVAGPAKNTKTPGNSNPGGSKPDMSEAVVVETSNEEPSPEEPEEKPSGKESSEEPSSEELSSGKESSFEEFVIEDESIVEQVEAEAETAPVEEKSSDESTTAERSIITPLLAVGTGTLGMFFVVSMYLTMVENIAGVTLPSEIIVFSFIALTSLIFVGVKEVTNGKHIYALESV